MESSVLLKTFLFLRSAQHDAKELALLTTNLFLYGKDIHATIHTFTFTQCFQSGVQECTSNFLDNVYRLIQHVFESVFAVKCSRWIIKWVNNIFMRYFFNFCNYTKTIIISHVCSHACAHSDTVFQVSLTKIFNLLEGLRSGIFMQHRSSSLKSFFPCNARNKEECHN